MWRTTLMRTWWHYIPGNNFCSKYTAPNPKPDTPILLPMGKKEFMKRVCSEDSRIYSSSKGRELLDQKERLFHLRLLRLPWSQSLGESIASSSPEEYLSKNGMWHQQFEEKTRTKWGKQAIGSSSFDGKSYVFVTSDDKTCLFNLPQIHSSKLTYSKIVHSLMVHWLQTNKTTFESPHILAFLGTTTKKNFMRQDGIGLLHFSKPQWADVVESVAGCRVQKKSEWSSQRSHRVESVD